jgi:hypothetical protein
MLNIRLQVKPTAINIVHRSRLRKQSIYDWLANTILETQCNLTGVPLLLV